MNELHEPVRQAQRRLWLNRWLSTLGWCLAAGAGLFVIAVVVKQVALADGAPPSFLTWCGGGLAGLSLVGSVIWTLLTRENLNEAAAQLDVAAGLEERLSTGLHCENSADPFARAVVLDAERVGKGLSARRHLPIRVPRSSNFAGGGLGVALLFWGLFPAVDLSGDQEKQEQEQIRADRVKASIDAIEPVLAKQVERLRQRNPDLKNEFEPLEAMDQDRLDTPLDVRREAMKKVDKLSRKLEEKRNGEDLAKMSELQKMLRRVASQQKVNTPVGDLAKALAKGDFKSAKAAMDAIKLKLAKAPKTDEEKKQAEQLESQLSALAKKIDQIAQDDKKTRSDLAKSGLSDKEIKRALEALKKKDFESVKKQLAKQGMSKKQLSKMMNQLQKRCAACSAASKMGQNMAKGGSGGKSGLSQSAQQGLSAAGEQLSELEGLQQQLNDLNASMAQLDSMKDQLGQGCSACNGTGMANGKPCGACQGTGAGSGRNRPGNGMGPLGQGRGGIAPEQETAIKTVREKAKVHTQAGRIIHQEFIDGEQFKGEASSDFVNVAISAERYATDALNSGKTPRMYQDAISKYWTRSRAALPADKVKAADAQAPGDQE